MAVDEVDPPHLLEGVAFPLRTGGEVVLLVDSHQEVATEEATEDVHVVMHLINTLHHNSAVFIWLEGFMASTSIVVNSR